MYDAGKHGIPILGALVRWCKTLIGQGETGAAGRSVFLPTCLQAIPLILAVPHPNG